MKSVPLANFAIALTKLKLRTALVRLRRGSLAGVAQRLPTSLLDDVRIAASDELAHRGLHVIAQRPPRSRKKVA